MKKAVVIVAGGSGTRMGASVPKQFLELNGQPILMHTIRRFYEFDPLIQIIVTVPAQERERWEQLCVQNNFDILHSIVNGGASRTESVRNGLARVDDDCIVGIHDGVRPFVSKELLTRCYNEAFRNNNAIPAIPVNETLRHVEGETNVTVDRQHFRLIQTPQCFDAVLLKRAYANSGKKEFTDDASVIEAIGERVHLCEGERSNIKITVPADLIIGEAILRTMTSI